MQIAVLGAGAVGVPLARAIAAGGHSWRAQPGTSADCNELPPTALQEALDRADAEDAPLRRDLCMRAFWTFGTALGRENTHATAPGNHVDTRST